MLRVFLLAVYFLQVTFCSENVNSINYTDGGKYTTSVFQYISPLEYTGTVRCAGPRFNQKILKIHPLVVTFFSPFSYQV